MDITQIVSVFSQLNWLEVLGAINTIVAALIVIFTLVPGEQPEKALRGFASLIGRISRK